MDILCLLKKVKRIATPPDVAEQYSACCPAHDDKKRSLSVGIDGNGKILVKCFAGCTIKQICDALNIKIADLMPPGKKSANTGVTVADLAAHKEIDESFLRELGCVDCQDRYKRPFVQITYRQADGTLAARQRKRRGLSGNEHSSWLPGDGSPVPYGLWRVGNKPGLVLCEGESDCWALWAEGIQAIGIPGADMTSKLTSLPEHVKEIYIVREPDKGGETFVPALRARLAEIGYKGKVFVVEMDKHKDPSAWRLQSSNFKDEFVALVQKIRANGNGSVAIPTSTIPDMAEAEYRAQTIIDPVEVAEEMPPFPVDVFPPSIADYLNAVAETIPCPVDYPGIAAIAALSILVGESEIAIKSDWIERANLYCGIVAPSGSGKTPAINSIMGLTLYEIETGYAERNEQYEHDYERDLAIYEIELTRWKADVKSLPTGAAKPDMPKKPERPPRKEIYTTDATTEALAEMLADNPSGILLMKDELTAWIKSLDQYKKGDKGTDREFFLSNWSGSPCKVNRKTKAPIIIPKPRLSVIGGIVPENLRLLAGKNRDGFFERVLCVFPKPIPRKFDGKAIDPRTREIAAQAFHAVMIPRQVTLKPNAQNMFGVFHEDQFSNPESWRPKLVSMAARFALLLCCVNNVSVCTTAIMAKALHLAEYAEAHIKLVSGEAGISEEMHETNAILDYCKRKGLELVKPRDLCMVRVPGCTSAKAARAKMQELVDLERAIWEMPDKILKIL